MNEKSQSDKDLVFSNCKIKKSYVHFIKKEIKNHPQAKTILLDGNKFYDEGLLIIIGSLMYSKINFIDLSNNNLTEKSLNALKQLCLKNK